MAFDFGSMADVKETEHGEAVATTKFDFSTAEDVPSDEKQAPSVISKFVRKSMKENSVIGPIEMFKTALYLAPHMPEYEASDNPISYSKKVGEILESRESDILKQGIGKVLETPFEAMIGLGLITAPLATVAGVGAFTIKDHFFNARRLMDEKFPDTSPEVKDMVELADFAISGALIGKGLHGAKQSFLGLMDTLKISRNVNVSPEIIGNIKESGNFTPEEKADLMKTMGVEQEHIDAALAGGVPINVPTSKVLDLAEKPYWEIAKHELLGGVGKEFPTEQIRTQMEIDAKEFMANQMSQELYKESSLGKIVKEYGGIAPYKKGMPGALGEEYRVNVPINLRKNSGLPLDQMADMLKAEHPYFGITDESSLLNALSSMKSKPEKILAPDVYKESPAPQELIKELKTIQTEKSISGTTLKRLKEFIGIDNIKKSSEPKIKKLVEFVKSLEPGDKFLSKKQLESLKEITSDLPVPEITPKRIVVEKFGDKADILNADVIERNIDPRLVPTVDIKKGHPLVEKVVERVDEVMVKAHSEITRRDKAFEDMIRKAEKSRDPLLPTDEKIKRKIYPQNKEIWEKLGGGPNELTKEEVAVYSYLKNFFSKAKEDLKLEAWRKNYVTHMEKPFIEKVLNKGLISAVKDLIPGAKQNELPIDIQLELDNIIGSEKFFKYAQERKGGVDPTTNLRKILHEYSTLFETKKALDQILPEGQAITRNLLTGKSAVWMKQFLQNLKGRGMDSNFKNGPMGWLGKVADGIVDVGYLKLLGLNWKSSLKNIVAGETNSWIYQDFPTYLKGKERFFSNPKKAYEMATEYGALEGTYADFAQKGIGQLKKYQDMMMIGQKVGEIEIRSSIFSSMLSEKEWKSGVLEHGHFSEIKDVIAKTQGVFSKWDSPLVLQTWYGRMFFQMNRWRITNAMLLKGIVSDAATDIKTGEFKTQNVTRLGKTLVAYGAGMYISYQLAQAGFKTASQVAKNMAQTIDGIMSLFTEGDLIQMFTDNPTLQTFKELSNTIQNTSTYLHVPGAKKTKERGIEDTYIAPVEGVEDILQVVPDSL